MQVELRDLVERARHGDRDASEALVRAGAGRLYAIAYRILREVDLANDALQEALVQVWDDLPTLRDPDRFDAWTYRITCRCCYRVAKGERHRSHVCLADPEAVDGSMASPWRFEADLVDRDEMERGFRRLRPEQRAVLVLHYYLGLTLSEISEALQVPAGTVGSRLHYATRSLRAALESEARASEAWGRPA